MCTCCNFATSLRAIHCNDKHGIAIIKCITNKNSSSSLCCLHIAPLEGCWCTDMHKINRHLRLWMLKEKTQWKSCYLSRVGICLQTQAFEDVTSSSPGCYWQLPRSSGLGDRSSDDCDHVWHWQVEFRCRSRAGRIPWRNSTCQCHTWSQSSTEGGHPAQTIGAVASSSLTKKTWRLRKLAFTSKYRLLKGNNFSTITMTESENNIHAVKKNPDLMWVWQMSKIKIIIEDDLEKYKI